MGITPRTRASFQIGVFDALSEVSLARNMTFQIPMTVLMMGLTSVVGKGTWS